MELSLSLSAPPVGLPRRRSSSLYFANVGLRPCARVYLPPVFFSLTKRIDQPSSSQICHAESGENHPKVLSFSNKEVPIIEARSVDDIYDLLTERLIQILDASSLPKSKYIVGLAGPPGAGKSTVASQVICRLNAWWNQRFLKMGSALRYNDVGIAVPMDGFHLYRSQLDKMENAEEAHARRGAPWTFDPARLLNCLQILRKKGEVSLPSFDHGVGDPVENDIVVCQHHQIVIVEGNYLLLDEGIWKDISPLFDEKWFIEVDIDTAMNRVLKRHISTGKAPDIARWRIEYNDRPNAELITTSKTNADLLIRSVDMNA